MHMVEGGPAIDPGMMSDPQREDGMSGSSNEGNLEILSLSCDLGTEWKGGVQANTEQNKTVDEVYKQQYLPEGSVLVESRSSINPLEAKKESSYEGRTFPLGTDVGSVDLYQLAEIVRGLEEEEVRFLLKSRELASKGELRDMGCLIMPEYGCLDILESLKEQLYFTSVAKDFLHVQLTEQAKLQMEFDRLDHQLVDEVSKLNALLKETRERNTSLSEELVQCRSELQAVAAGREELQNQFLSSRKDIEEFTARAYESQSKLENSHKELTSLSTELADCRGLAATLQMENASLNGSLSLVTEERKKLEEEKEYFVNENMKFSSVLVEHQVRLATEHGKHMQLEVELKEVILRLEQLTEENIFLSSSLDIHKAKVKEIDNSHTQLSSQVEASNQLEGFDVSNTVCETDDDGSHRSSGKHNCEVAVGKSLSLGLAEGSPHQQLEGEVSDDSVGFKVLKGHLEEAEIIMQKLEMAIKGMHSHSESLSRAASKVAGSGVSKLIQAFESKVHHDDTESEEMPLIEERSAADQFKLAEEQTSYLRAVLKELYWDAEKSDELFREEHDSRKLSHVALREFGDQCEASKQHIRDLEAKNKELEVLYDAMKQQASNFEAKNNEFKVLYEASKQQAINLEVRNSELVNNLADYQSRIGELQYQFYEIQQSSDVMAATIITQLENLQKEAGEKASTLEQEWGSTVATIVETVEKLDSSIAKLFTSRSTEPFDTSDLTYTDHEAISCSYKELNEKFSDLHAENELAVGLLVKMYGGLRKLLNDSNGYAEGSEMNGEGDRLHDLLQPRNYETLIEQLGKLLGEKLRLEYVNNELVSELINRKQDVEELNKRCLDSRAILKLVEDVERIVKPEDMEIDSE
ncbi:hypothetical protein HHK36_032615 [Tetracentron sinense]|uniref:Uncharacterized protein n=1 Tax=Tetracentron sinense TaxID=13715 RepID=A0A835CZD8_TETSI|nr:hypothetical protein HHK36_032615 [Tetracentron sinense]